MNPDALKFRRAAEALDAGAFYGALAALAPHFDELCSGWCPFCDFRELFDRNEIGPLCMPTGKHGVIALLLAGEMERTGDLRR